MNCLIEEEAILITKEISKVNPHTWDGDDDFCRFCNMPYDYYEDKLPHTKDCIWLRCKQLFEKI
jgi:hypothetical protein